MKDIPLSQIECLHVRIDPEFDLASISESLSKIGQLSPVRLRPHPEKTGMYQVIFGNRRVMAAKKLGWKTISAEVSEMSDIDSILIAYFENAERKDFSDYEKAILLEKLHQLTGKSYLEIAGMIGKSPAYVSQHVAMLNLFPKSIDTDEERKRVLCHLSEKQARALTKVYDTKERWSLAKLAVEQDLAPNELEKICNRTRLRRQRDAGSTNPRASIQRIIQSMLDGFNSKDVRPFSDAICTTQFSLFSSFPPFVEMDHDTALDHICAMLRQMDYFHASNIEKLQVRVSGRFAYAIMVVVHDFGALGKTVKIKMRATVILEKRKSWKIVHIHWSPTAPEEFLRLFTTADVPQLSVSEIRNLNSSDRYRTRNSLAAAGLWSGNSRKS